MSIIKTPKKYFIIRAVENCKISADYYDIKEQVKYPPKLETLSQDELIDLEDCIYAGLENAQYKEVRARYEILLDKIKEI